MPIATKLHSEQILRETAVLNFNNTSQNIPVYTSLGTRAVPRIPAPGSGGRTSRTTNGPFQ
jgi:hypothetical protein